MTDRTSATTHWHVLSPYLIRAAGFAFGRLEALRCTTAASAVGELARAASARQAAGAAFDQAVSQERYGDNPEFDDPAVRKQLSKNIKHARAFARALNDVAPPQDALGEVLRVSAKFAPQVDELVTTHARWQAATRASEAAFAADFEQARAALRRLYGDDARLQEAVFLESPEAFERIQQLLSAEGPRNARARQRERLAVMYAQRFCAKNDTNSICGPHGVAYLDDPDNGTAHIDITVEDARRATYFSHWAAQALLDEAVRLAGDSAAVTLRLHPTVRIEGSTAAWCTMDHDATTMFRRRYARSELPGATAELLRALAGPRSRAEIAEIVQKLELDAEEVMPFLDELVEAGVVVRGPRLAPGLFQPLRAVAEELERWPESEARTWAIAEVAALEELVAAFARAPLTERLSLYRQLAARFAEASGTAAARGEGNHYADRSVLHEDCYAEVSASLGETRASLDSTIPVIISALELPLALSRERVREWFRARFGERTRVPALTVHRAFDEDQVLETPAATPHAAALRIAMDRVAEAIGRAADAAAGGPVRVATDELRTALAAVAPPTHAGYVSADAMLRRRASGDTDIVLGEVHGFFWLPTCLLDVLPPAHRDRVVDRMQAAVREMAHGKTTAETVFLHTQATDRRFPLATTDLQMLTPSDRPDALDFGALDLRLDGDEFVFLHGDEEVVPLVAYTRYPFILYTSRIAPLFDDFAERFFPDRLLPPAWRDSDAPRLQVDDVIITRRVWRRSAKVVREALAATSEADLFRRAQALRQQIGCGERVFVSLTGEPKPVLLDFHNVFLLEALVNLLERQPDDASVRIREMVPGPEELVARGPDGLRTSELRIGFYRS